MAKLFINHASEDKQFARPLAEELRRRGHEVWFDEFSMTMGDSLRAKIDEGLAKCDFGVVILSPRFFEKDWTQKELDALVSMETRSRKIILPVWLDLNKEGVTKKSPILASRVAAHAASGVPAVADAVEVAIDAQQKSSRSDELSAAMDELRQTGATHRAKKTSDQLLQSERGPAITIAAFKVLLAKIERVLVQIRNETGLEFVFQMDSDIEWHARTIKMLRASISLEKLYVNTAYHALLVFRVHQVHARGPVFGGSDLPISEAVFRPFALNSSELAWLPEEGNDMYSQDSLAGLIIRKINDAIEETGEESYQ